MILINNPTNYGYNCDGDFVGETTMDDGCCTYPNNGDYSLSFDGEDYVDISSIIPSIQNNI